MSKPFLGTDFWQQHVHSCVQEGISQAAYCRQHGLVISQFGYWYRKLATDHTGSWLPVEVKPVFESIASLDLILAGERTLRIKEGFDEILLKQIILAVEATP